MSLLQYFNLKRTVLPNPNSQVVLSSSIIAVNGTAKNAIWKNCEFEGTRPLVKESVQARKWISMNLYQMRQLILGEQLDKQVQSYVLDLHSNGAVINSSLTIAVA